jgi:serine/threonine protein phosphatase PrpC
MSAILGAGPLWNGTPHPSGRAEYPPPTRIGTPIGEHLRVESLVRVCEGRMLYLVNNLGPKWSRRKCWSCGNKYSPSLSKCCSFCLTPLRDLRLLMTERWSETDDEGFEAFAALRLQHFGLVTPLAVYRRLGKLLAIYHYNGEHLLIDEAAPMASDRLVMVGRFLSRVLEFLHQSGIVLRRLTPANVLVMPDDSVRVFDLDVETVLADEVAVRKHKAAPVARDAQALCTMLLPWATPEDIQVRSLLEKGANGRFTNPKQLGDAFEDLAARSGPRPNPRAAAMSEVGLVRDGNEDAWWWRRLADPMVLYALSDGMGGHASGEVASKIACKTVSDVLGTLPAQVPQDAIETGLREAITTANAEIRAYGKKHGAILGATMVAAVVAARKSAVIAHCGDSRAYLWDGAKLVALTRDMNLAREIMDQKKITLEAAMTHPNANVLTSSLGGEVDDLEIETKRVDGKPGQQLVLCSDGLWGPVKDDEIAAILKANKDRGAAVRALVAAAIEAGAPDNVTVVIVEFG